MKVLILNGDLPVFPGWGGVEFLHTTGLARLAEKVGLVSLVHTPEQAAKVRGLTEAGVALYLWRSPALEGAPGPPPPARKRHRARRVLERAHRALERMSGRPSDTIVQDLQYRNLAPDLMRARAAESWQTIVVVQTSSARWLDYMPRAPIRVLVMHDVRALVYERQARTAPTRRERARCRREARRYRRFERHYCREVDLVVTVSPVDDAYVREHYAPAVSLEVPLPVDAAYFRSMLDLHEAPARIVFTGLMAHPPNVAAARFFATEVLPAIRRVVPEAEFWIVGRDPVASVRELSLLPGVAVTGAVEDIRPYLARASVVVVPLLFGAGMRQKILEAWAMERPVVSTRVGAEGLDVQDGVNIHLADDAATFAARVVELLGDRAERDRLRTAGRAVVTTRHDPGRLTRSYWSGIARVAESRRAASPPFRAVVDLRWMRPGTAGGIENLSRSFVSELVRRDAWNRYTLLLPAECRYDFDLRGQQNVVVQASDGPRAYVREFGTRAARLLAAAAGVQYWQTPEVAALRRARRLEAEVALSIPGYIHPDLATLANVLVMPDIQHEYHPEFFGPDELAERRRLYTGSARQAAHICAISEFTRQTLIERLDIPAERITATPLAADPMFHPGSPARGRREAVTARYRLPAGEYVIFPGNTWPHKNHLGAFRALSVLREEHGLAPLLVCTGARKDSQGALTSAAAALGLERQVRFLGYCPASDLPGLYEGAAAMLFPSFFEGFGMPVLEAMWCGCPVVCSDTTSLPEVAGDAALMADPRSPAAMAAGLARALTDSDLRSRLVARGFARAPRFSWTRFTLDVVRILRAVHERQFA